MFGVCDCKCMCACVCAAPNCAIAMETKDLTHAKLGEDGEGTACEGGGAELHVLERLMLQPAEAPAADRWPLFEINIRQSELD